MKPKHIINWIRYWFKLYLKLPLKIKWILVEFFIGIKSAKSEAKTFEFSGPLKQMLIIRVLCKNYNFLMKSKRRNSRMHQVLIFVLQKLLLSMNGVLKTNCYVIIVAAVVMGFGSVVTWKPLTGWGCTCTCMHICFSYLLKYCVYLLQAIQKFIDLCFGG